MLNIESIRHSLGTQMPAALEMLRSMVEINSFTTNIEGVNRLGRLTSKCFEPLGFVPEFVDSKNAEWGQHLVLTRKGRSSRNIALVSHLDTVFPPEEERQNNFHWQPEGDRIFGPGTHDIKGGTVMMWLVLCAIKQHLPRIFEDATWKLFWNSSEECFSEDFAEVCRSRFDSGTLAALVFEAEGRSTNSRSLVVARKGRGTWRIVVSGRGAHAGGKHRHGANAVIQLGRTIQRVAALTDYSRDLTFTVATMHGGTVLNRIPHEAIAEGEFRAFSPKAYCEGRDALLGLCGAGDIASPADGYPCVVRVEILSETRPWVRNAQTDSLFQLWRQIGKELGVEVEPEERGGLSDGNLLWDVVPTLDGLGPWGDNDHCSERTPDGAKLPEFVEVSSFVPKALLNVLALQRLATS